VFRRTKPRYEACLDKTDLPNMRSVWLHPFTECVDEGIMIREMEDEHALWLIELLSEAANARSGIVVHGVCVCGEVIAVSACLRAHFDTCKYEHNDLPLCASTHSIQPRHHGTGFTDPTRQNHLAHCSWTWLASSCFEIVSNPRPPLRVMR
jgi:hypothetical protein